MGSRSIMSQIFGRRIVFGGLLMEKIKYPDFSEGKAYTFESCPANHELGNDALALIKRKSFSRAVCFDIF